MQKYLCVKKIVVSLQRITDEICKNKQFSSVENKGSTMINRESYLSQLIKLRDQDLIKVVTGIRRCGKSTLLMAFRQYLYANGVQNNAVLNY